MGQLQLTGGSTFALWLSAIIAMFCFVWASSRPKEIETVITGTKYSEKEGSFVAPPGFPDEPYPLDATSYIFVLENVMIEGSVEVSMETYDINPKSWLTVRNSKYGGYIGQVIGRYDIKRAPPTVITTDTCCLRLEFQTGCCGPEEPLYTGIKATYRFLPTPGKGRRADCSHDPVFSQLCNGECIPPSWGCPCPLYGQYKCENGICIDRELMCDGKDQCGDRSDEMLCDEEDTTRDRPAGLGAMFTFSVIITTVCSLLGFVCVMIFILSTTEKLINKYKSQGDSNLPPGQWCPQGRMLRYAKLWPVPEVGTLPYHGNQVTRTPETIVLQNVSTNQRRINSDSGYNENSEENVKIKNVDNGKVQRTAS